MKEAQGTNPGELWSRWSPVRVRSLTPHEAPANAGVSSARGSHSLSSAASEGCLGEQFDLLGVRHARIEEELVAASLGVSVHEALHALWARRSGRNGRSTAASPPAE